MKKYLITTVIALIATFSINAQEAKIKVEKGDLLEIVKPSSHEFKYINFPKKNFIIKRGGIANDKLVNGEEVVVTKVTKEKDGSTTISIKPTDGSRFYQAIPIVTVDFEKAIKSGEIKVLEI
ncbi:hypothetical protein [Polaribacter glomeratus]|uniref:Dihydroorotase n=1 Tax=Polaribacter glomeratus TaxID=102 RepID=A0A2S7WUZ8_9FLAO|nr:hypothetical protein [Polaribacter glomeratus]PQJ81405.1 hypothetical protein BTO16_01900 [Polaribacter glomeratus]TXD64795.1 hypothetical protein ESX12_13340 [Polaribacter glomeratus]